MKTRINSLLLIFFVGITAFSQSVVGTGPGQEPQVVTPLHTVFANLEKDRVPYGLLLDAAVETANMSNYTGVITDSSYTSSKLVMDVYNTLLLSRLSTNADITKTSQNFASDWKNAQQIDVVPLGGVFYKYSQFSDVTVHNAQATGNPVNVTITDGQIWDKYNGRRWINPYDDRYAFAIAPAINSFNKFNFKIKLPDNLFLSNQASEIEKIEYKLDDSNPYQLLNYNQLINVNYTSVGTHHWTFKMTLYSGEVLYTHTQFTIDGNLDKYVADPGQGEKTSNLSQYSKVALYSPETSGRATMYIKLAPGHTQITTPLIVAEGFDLGNIIYPSREAGITNIDGFLGSLNGSSALASQLNGNYDIIYVDWNNGVDYIQNNAKLFVKAIQWVNANKAGTTKNVIIGQSMGGLIARYALKDMEDHGLVHDAKLYISHDSPHLGANIPLGLQYMLRNITSSYFKSPSLVGIGQFTVPIFNQGVSVGDVLTLTDTPAARQMLINYVGSNYQIDNSIHNNWQNELKVKGYPQLTRNVAISNGSECGTDQALNDLLRVYKETGNLHIINDIAAVLVGALTDNPNIILLSTLPGNSKFVFDMTVRPMANLNENKQLYNGSIKYKKKVLWLVNVEVSILNGSRNQPSNIFPIDKYGGGKFSLALDLPSYVSVSKFGFIPTPSSLDYKLGNVTLTESDYQKSFSPVDDAANVPFVNFVAERTDANNVHTTFNYTNGQFFLNQLSSSLAVQNQPVTTAFLCGSKVNIGGAALICGNSQVTYTTGFAPAIQWSIISGGNLVDINGPTNQPQISFTPKPNANGLIKLQAYLSGGGESNTVTKNIWIGKPMFSISQINNPSYYNESHFYLSYNYDTPVNSEQGITQIKWTKISASAPGVVLHAYANQFEAFASGPNNNWTMDIEVEATNACGTSVQTVMITPPPALPCETFTITKTEESSDTYVVLKSVVPPCVAKKETISKQGDKYQIIIANSLGKIITTKVGDTFNLNGLQTGTYFVNVSQNNINIVSQTIIKR